MFFRGCKIRIHSNTEYNKIMNHLSDVLHKTYSVVDRSYPLYLIMSDDLKIEHTFSETEFDNRKNPKMSPKDFLYSNYIISYHFCMRFSERVETVSATRLLKVLKNMMKRGTWLKRRDSYQLMKYKTTSDYVLYSQYEGSEKKHYLIVISDSNILTTIYEFNIKDLKHFKEP